MKATIAEPVHVGDGPLIVHIRIQWGPPTFWDVAASYNGQVWYVTGLERPCRWEHILPNLLGTNHAGDHPYTVTVTRLTP